jgi:hypothetical protein
VIPFEVSDSEPCGFHVEQLQLGLPRAHSLGLGGVHYYRGNRSVQCFGDVISCVLVRLVLNHPLHVQCFGDVVLYFQCFGDVTSHVLVMLVLNHPFATSAFVSVGVEVVAVAFAVVALAARSWSWWFWRTRSFSWTSRLI